ncbi:MAG: carboxypeptidase-like regulatory domain-containing protein [Staphylococcus sp.]|nr:carboxypeptidase-like regulatory domain-containing protein [Staphylococcus sp.]
MRHIYQTLFRLLAVCILTMICQEVRAWQISGHVVEASGEALPGVVVKLVDGNGKTVAFCSTDNKGSFTLRRSQAPDGKWMVSFAFLGYETRKFPVEKVNDGMKVVMSDAPLELKEVVVKVAPIKNIGDTLVYDVASFRSAADRNIEDVIKKLPGVEVASGGTIYYNGEPINRFYIEGLDVVSGRYAIATRNISPDDIMSVDVYENHQPKRVLKDLSISDKAAINLTMKKKSMLRPVGNITGGVGLDDNSDVKWLGELFGMLISPSSQILLTAKTNNHGNSYADETQQLISGMREKSSQASKLYGETPFGTANIPSERYFDNRSISASVNSIRKFGKYGKLGITADYNDENNRTDNSETIVYSNGDNPDINFHEEVRSHPHSREAKVNVNIENNAPQTFFTDKISFRGRFADNRYDIVNSGRVNQQSRTDDYYISNLLDGTFKKGRRLVAFSSDISLVTTPVSRLCASQDEVSLLSQSGRALSFTTSEKASASLSLGSASSLGVNLRFDSAYDLFKSDYSTGTDGSVANNVRGYDLKVVTEPEYRYKPGYTWSLSVRVPLSYTAMKFHNRISGKEYPTDRFDAGVNASFNIRPSGSFRASLTLRQQNSLGGIRDYIVNPVYITYRQRSTFGSGDLNNRETYGATANIFYRDPIKAFFVTLLAGYRLSRDNVISGSDVTTDQVASSVSNSKNSSRMFNVDLTVSKNMRDWRTTFTLDGHIAVLSRKVLRQKLPYTVSNTSYVIHAAVNSNPIASIIDVSAELWYKPSVQKISAMGMRNTVDDIVAQGNVSVHPFRRVEVYSEVYWSKVSVAAGTSKSSLFVGAGVRYHKKPFAVELSGKNLTNTKSYSYTYFMASDLYSHTFSLRPAELLLSVKYTF